jgi:diacylglycerol kinase family enzyme
MDVITKEALDAAGIRYEDVASELLYRTDSFAVLGSSIEIMGNYKTSYTAIGYMEITMADGTVKTLDNHAFLFIAIANGRFCGGGFEGAPAASTDDGLLDVLMVHDLDRKEFIKLVADYRRGTHVDRKTGRVAEKFVDKIIYEKCRSVHIDSMDYVCADGEILADKSLDVTVERTPLIYAPNLSCLPDDLSDLRRNKKD